MNATSILGVMAACIGVAMGASPMLQAVRAHRRGSADDVSLAFLGILWSGGFVWLAYGLAKGDAPLVVANMTNVAATGTAIAVTVRTRRRSATAGAETAAP